MVSCRVRVCDNKVRCFRCLAFGHMARSCTGPDKSGCCIRCGSSGHKVAECEVLSATVKVPTSRNEEGPSSEQHSESAAQV